VQVASPTPQAAGRLFANSPDVSKFLAVIVIGSYIKGVLGFVPLYLDGNVAEAGGFEDVLGLCRPLEGHKKQRQGNRSSFRRPKSG
jgi:hypothetical protein